jgi:hypothetical protein
VFIPEQINSTMNYNIVDYVGRSMFSGLRMLPLHDDIEITDDVGNVYTPDAGNIEVSLEQTTFDVGTVRIAFNDGAMNWVNAQTAIT